MNFSPVLCALDLQKVKLKKDYKMDEQKTSQQIAAHLSRQSVQTSTECAMNILSLTEPEEC